MVFGPSIDSWGKPLKGKSLSEVIKQSKRFLELGRLGNWNSKNCVPTYESVLFQYLICSSICSSCNTFLHTLIKWNSETIRCFDFLKRQVLKIRGKCKIYNVTKFSLAQLEIRHDFTICKHDPINLVQSQTRSKREMAWCYFKSQKSFCS